RRRRPRGRLARRGDDRRTYHPPRRPRRAGLDTLSRRVSRAGDGWFARRVGRTRERLRMIERRVPGTFGAAWLVARKDLTIEFRTRTAFLSAVVAAALTHSIFYFAWDDSIITPSELAPGVLWVVLAFSALLGLQRSFGLEEHDRGIDALLVSPVSRESIYIGKAVGNLIFLTAIQLVAIPALALFYNVHTGGSLLAALAVVLLAIIGIVAVGTLFSAMAVN